MSYRLIYLGLGLVAVAAVAFGIVLSTEGEEIVLPGPIEAVSPGSGDLMPPQSAIEIDLEAGYRADIFVDGWLVEDAIFVEGTGVYRWAPSASSPTITEWAPGEHTVEIRYDTINGLPDPGEFSWSFRIG